MFSSLFSGSKSFIAHITLRLGVLVLNVAVQISSLVKGFVTSLTTMFGASF
jgi:hypothetical protein